MHWPGHKLAIGMFFGVVVGWLLVMAIVIRHSALPSEATGTMLVVFEPGLDADSVFASLTRAEASIVRPTAFDFVWIVSSATPGLVGRLAKQGAIGAYRELPFSPTIAGCFAFADAKAVGYLQ